MGTGVIQEKPLNTEQHIEINVSITGHYDRAINDHLLMASFVRYVF